MAEPQLKEIMFDAMFGNAGSMTKAEFNRAFKSIIEQIIRFEKKLLDNSSSTSRELKAQFTILQKRFETENYKGFADHKKEIKGIVSKAIERLDARSAAIKQPLNGIDGLDGRDGRDGKDGKDGVKGQDGKDGSPDTGEEIIKKVNHDPSDRLIRKGKVEGLEELEKRVRTTEVDSRQFLRSGGDTVYMEDLSAQTDGLTKVFTVPYNRRAIMVAGSDFPSVLFPSNGFTVAGTTLTLTTDNAPSEGSQLGFMYVI